MPCSGSPPLTRGQRKIMSEQGLTQGITPAHAGTTCSVAVRDEIDWDHPRSRGDNTARSGKPTSSTGSPPLTRGQLKIARHKKGDNRITPAHAGTTRPAMQKMPRL